MPAVFPRTDRYYLKCHPFVGPVVIKFAEDGSLFVQVKDGPPGTDEFRLPKEGYLFVANKAVVFDIPKTDYVSVIPLQDKWD